MPTPVKILLVGTASAMLLSAASYADGTTEDIHNTQVLNGGPFISSLRQTVGDVQSVVGQVTALGNTLSIDFETGNVILTNDQTLNASGLGESIINVNIAPEGVTSSASVLGNSATITATNGSILSTSNQVISAGNDINAVSNLNISNWALNPNTSALAVGNAISTYTEYGVLVDSFVNQVNGASIRSEAFIDGGGLLADSATVVSTAIANTGSAGGMQTSTIVDVDQRSNGPLVEAVGGIVSPDAGDYTVAVTATGNNFTTENAYGFVQSEVLQNNASQVRAQADVTADLWSYDNSISSYAVGNSNLTTNEASDIVLQNVQINNGQGIEAISNFTGGDSGGVGRADFQVVSSAAFGNAVSAFNCSTCGGGIFATNNQSNSASISATTTISAGNGGTIIGTATAVGNSASYRTGGD